MFTLHSIFTIVECDVLYSMSSIEKILDQMRDFVYAVYFIFVSFKKNEIC
jgi:hypothetical protein